MLTNQGICTFIIGEIAKYNSAAQYIMPYKTFKDLGIDSLDLFCIILDIEFEFSVKAILENPITINNSLQDAADTIFCLILNKK